MHQRGGFILWGYHIIGAQILHTNSQETISWLFYASTDLKSKKKTHYKIRFLKKKILHQRGGFIWEGMVYLQSCFSLYALRNSFNGFFISWNSIYLMENIINTFFWLGNMSNSQFRFQVRFQVGFQAGFQHPENCCFMYWLLSSFLEKKQLLK